MSTVLDFVLVLLRQFSGGPGPLENNLVRFGLPAILWAALLAIACSRQRNQALPREKLLAFGFGLGLIRELYMFAQMAERIIGGPEHSAEHILHQPLEHTLSMGAVVVVAAAFLRYVLDDARLSRTYLQFGLGTTILCLCIALWQWPRHLASFPEAQFHQSWGAWLFHVPLSLCIMVAVWFLSRKRGWLRAVVSLALAFFFLSEFLFLLNYAFEQDYNYIICPISNSFHTLAIPLLGYVYLREQAVEKRRAEEALAVYRDHLEELVKERTAELAAANSRLAAQNTIAATLSQSLELDTILKTALDMVLPALDMAFGLVFVLDPDTQTLALRAQRWQDGRPDVQPAVDRQCACFEISQQAMAGTQAVVRSVDDDPAGCPFADLTGQGWQTLLSAPLVAQGQAVGVLTLGTPQARTIQLPERELLTAIGQQTGVAIENARLYREAEQRAEELTLLRQVSISLTSTLDPEQVYQRMAEQSIKLLSCQAACVVVTDRKQLKVEIVSSYGISQAARRVLQTEPGAFSLLPNPATEQRLIAIEDIEHDAHVSPVWREHIGARALLCLPIWSSEEPPRFLFLIDRQVSRRWRPEELRLFESFANRAAVALVNARLHKQLEWAATLEERQRIAANMHDGLAQTLGFLGLKVDRVVEMVKGGSVEDAVHELGVMRGAVEQASGEVRRSISSLQDAPQARRPLQELLSDLAAQFSANGGPAIELLFRAQEPLFLPPEQRTQVLPIVQEAVLNAQRHAHAKQIVLVLDNNHQHIQVTIQDDGQGFELDESRAQEGHFGLSIMHARAARMGARLEIESEPGRGTRVSLSWAPDGDGSMAGSVAMQAGMQPA